MPSFPANFAGINGPGQHPTPRAFVQGIQQVANSALNGVTLDSNGVALAYCTVKVFVTATDALFGQTVSDINGNWSIPVSPGGAYYVVEYKQGTPDVEGTSVNTLVPGALPWPQSASFPQALFNGKAQGFAFDFSDASKLYQNSNQTGAVASNNDPIGFVQDLSGNANHGTQATGTSRPLWGGKRVGAVGDGTRNINCGPATMDWTGATAVTIIACVQANASANAGVFQIGSFNAGNCDLAMNSAAGGLFVATMYGATFNPATLNSRGVVSATQAVVTAVMDRSQATAILEVVSRYNGEAYGNSVQATGASGTSNFTNSATNVLSNYQGNLNGSLSRIIVIARLLSATELLAAEAWAGAAAAVAIVPEIPPSGPAYYNLIATYGQSLSTGVNTDVESPSVLSTATRFGDLMFTSGVHVSANGNNQAGLVALVESTAVESANNEGETPVSGICEMLHELNGDVSGYTPYRVNPYIGATAGFPALTMANLSQGQAQYNIFKTINLNAWRRAKERGQEFKQRAFFWMQGESDGANASYDTLMQTLQQNITTDFNANTLQTEPIWMLTYQLDRAFIGLKHLLASDNYANIRVCMPMYHIPHETDLVHLTPKSYKICGAYFAYAYDQIINKGNAAWQPLKCTAHNTVTTTCTLTFNPVGQLALDTTLVASQTNSGFKLFQSDGTTIVPLTSVALSGTNQVVITATGTIPAGAIVKYGFTTDSDNTAGIAKGNLRDTQGNTVVFNGGGLNYPLHNWCVLFKRTVN